MLIHVEMKGQCGQIFRPICPNSQEYVAFRQLPLLKIHEYRNSFKVKPQQSTRRSFKKTMFSCPHTQEEVCFFLTSWRNILSCSVLICLVDKSGGRQRVVQLLVLWSYKRGHGSQHWQHGDAADASSVPPVPEMLAVSAGVTCLWRANWRVGFYERLI